MKCEQLIDQLDAIALTPPTEMSDASVLGHLADCDSCRAELHARQEAWLALSAGLPVGTEAAPSDLESRIFDRIEQPAGADFAASSEKRIGQSANDDYSRAAIIWKYVIAASVLFFLVSASISGLGQVGKGEPNLSDGEIVSIREIAKQVEKIDKLERMFASPRVKYVSLETKSDESPTGFFVHDPMSAEFHFFGKNLLRNTSRDSRLRVWLLDGDGRVITSSDVQTNNNGSVGTALLNDDRANEVVALLVTSEQGLQSTSPSKDVVFRSELGGF